MDLRISAEIKNDYLAVIEKLSELYLDCEHCYKSLSIECADCKVNKLIAHYERERNYILYLVEEKLEVANDNI